MHIAVGMGRAGALIGGVMLAVAMTAGASAEDLRARGADQRAREDLAFLMLAAGARFGIDT